MKKILVLGLFLFASIITVAQHSVVMKSGEKMNGTVESMKDGVISFKYKGNDMKLKVSEVSAVYFDDKVVVAAQDKSLSGKEAMTKVTPPGAGEKTITSGSYVVRYKCASRVITKPPVVSNLTEEKGTVAIDIAINKYGNVLKATVSPNGTTTDSEYLRTKAIQAAQSAMFDNVPTAPLETKGYMIIVF